MTDNKQRQVEYKAREALPHELMAIINELLQQEWRDKYDIVVQQIKDVLDKDSDLKPKRKYIFLLGTSAYRQYHRTWHDDIRIASIYPQYEGCNSIVLRPHKLLLAMGVCRCRHYDEEDYRRFSLFHTDIEEAMYDNYPE